MSYLGAEQVYVVWEGYIGESGPAQAVYEADPSALGARPVQVVSKGTLGAKAVFVVWEGYLGPTGPAKPVYAVGGSLR